MTTEVWDADRLMGNGVSKEAPKDPLLWGLPGHLTQEESDVFFKFRAELEKRGGEFRDTVYCFGEEEGEAFALSRWLRARKFVYEDVIKMVEEATQVRKHPKAKEFYPDPVDALGCEAALFFDQYPQLYSGIAKNGAPIFISKPGILNVDGMECITTLDGIIQFHWHVMMHDFANRLRVQKAENPDKFKRFECFCILDLAQLTTSSLSRRSLAIIKEQAAIDSICFPETMAKMLIVNAPTFFSASWRIIKGWLDPRTSGKIEVISSTSTMHKRLLALVDADQLPSDYGGTGQDTHVTMQESGKDKTGRLVTKVLYLRGHGSEICEVRSGETLEITVYTHSTAGAKFTLTDADTKAVIGATPVEVIHPGTEDTSEPPSSKVISMTKITGPVKIKVKADSNANRFSMHNYLLAFALSKV